jgi:hypothetical protein
MDRIATGFTKQAGVLWTAAKKIVTPRNVGRTALVGGGAVAGGMGVKALSKQRPLPAGALAREKRRMEIDRYGSL